MGRGFVQLVLRCFLSAVSDIETLKQNKLLAAHNHLHLLRLASFCVSRFCLDLYTAQRECLATSNTSHIGGKSATEVEWVTVGPESTQGAVKQLLLPAPQNAMCQC